MGELLQDEALLGDRGDYGGDAVIGEVVLTQIQLHQVRVLLQRFREHLRTLLAQVVPLQDELPEWPVLLNDLSEFLGILEFQKIVREVDLDHEQQVDALDGTPQECRPLVLDFQLPEVVPLLQVLLCLLVYLVVRFYLNLNVLHELLILDLVAIVNEKGLNTGVDLQGL